VAKRPNVIVPRRRPWQVLLLLLRLVPLTFVLVLTHLIPENVKQVVGVIAAGGALIGTGSYLVFAGRRPAPSERKEAFRKPARIVAFGFFLLAACLLMVLTLGAHDSPSVWIEVLSLALLAGAIMLIWLGIRKNSRTAEVYPGKHESRPVVTPTEGNALVSATPALRAVEEAGLVHRVIRHGPVRNLAEAAAARGVDPADVIKTLVVRRGDEDFLFVLVPGDRTISWPKLRRLLGVSRLSMPDALAARTATGYERGTITPFGSLHPWPVIADTRITGRQITLGAGEHGSAIALAADDTLRALNAQVADISDEETP